MCFFFHKWGRFGELKRAMSSRTTYSEDLYCEPERTDPVIETYQERVCDRCGRYDKRIVDLDYNVKKDIK